MLDHMWYFAEEKFGSKGIVSLIVAKSVASARLHLASALQYVIELKFKQLEGFQGI